MRAVVFSVVLILVAASSAARSGEMEDTCHRITPDTRDCSCVVNFLREQLGTENGLIVLDLLLAEKLNLDANNPYAGVSIHRKYGHERLMAASVALDAHREDFVRRCHPRFYYDY